MHLTEETMMSGDRPELLGPPPPPPLAAQAGRPWDYDTEDSGVDSVSSVVGLEADQQGRSAGVEYAEVMLGSPGQKSFLHTVYNNNDAEVMCYDDVSNRNNIRTLPAIETAKNCFLHSLLEEQDDEPPGSAEPPPPSTPTAATTVGTKKLSLLPELIHLLDSEGGTIELVGKDGTRASLKVTLVPPGPAVVEQPPAPAAPSLRAKSSFNRAHRNSVKRGSQRRSNKGSGPGAETGGVRRRPSNGGSSGKRIAMVTPSTKVATLASKFNLLINESRRSHGTTSNTSGDKTLSLSPARRAKGAQQSGKLGSVVRSAGGGIRRNSSVKPRIDTIPETVDPLPADEECKQPRRKSHQSDELRPLPSDPAATTNSSKGMYGTVKSIVKQAIRKFEKLDGAPVEPQMPDQPGPSVDYASTVLPGIAPNTSFLWRDQRSMQNLIYEATSFNERAGSRSESYYDTLCTRRPTSGNAYDSLNHNKSSSSSSSNGYDEIQSPKSESHKSPPSVKYDDIIKPSSSYDQLSFLHSKQYGNGYDELQSPPSISSSGGYIDPGSSSALGYERILPSEGHNQASDEDGSTLRYEECGSPPPAGTSAVKAKPSVAVRELDSLSYLYDDIRGGGIGGYGGSHHSYEPIYAHLGEGKASLPGHEDNHKSSDTLSGSSSSSEEGAHEVYSYRLTQLGQQNQSQPVPDSPAPSLAGTSTASTTRTGTERRSETSDEWVDVSDPEEPAWTVTRVRIKRHESTNASFARRGHRASRRKMSIPKPVGSITTARSTWSQTMRTLVRNGLNKAATLSRRTGRDVLGMRLSGNKGNTPESSSNTPQQLSSPPAVQLKKSSARRLPSVETEASGTGSSQTWEDCGESDGDDLADDHHYEALYEVVNPRVQQQQSGQQDDSFDDSFDSDDAFEEAVVRGVDTTSVTSRDRPGSRTGSERSKESEDPSMRSGQYGVGISSRFADLAGEQMRRLRRNWSTTKTDITQTITRIKKKSTASVADLSEVFKMGGTAPTPTSPREDSSPEKELPSPPIKEVRSPASKGESNKKMGTWALRQIRRRMTVSPTSGNVGKNKEPSTFYLTLTIEQGQPPTISTPSPASDGSSSEAAAASTPSPVPPLVNPQQVSAAAPSANKLPARPKRTSSASSLGGPHYQPTVRPKTAPPAPPVRSPSVPDNSVPSPPAAAPVSTGPKKPLARLTASSSESRLAACKSLDDYQTQYCDIAIGQTAGIRPTSGSGTPGSNTPYSRLSLASNGSHNSSGTYMSVGDVASGLEHQQGRSEEVRSYMDLQPPLESEELYMSSHFADEPLYQFYTAAIIERAANRQGEGSEEDDYEVIGEHRRKEESLEQKDNNSSWNGNKLPTAMELATPVSGRRTLWCELPQVINSGLLETISPQQRKLQEAMFELITSEASYLRSLNVLTTHFIQSREFCGDPTSGMEPVLSRLERHTLFSDILPVRECSEALLTDLEKRWQENIFIREICDILLDHASKHFEVYIRYCTNQLYQERMLRELKDNKPQFVEVLRKLEASPVCQSLAMHSFLMLPMQRITRLPLLVDAIFHRLESGTPEYDRCRMTVATLNKIVQECNEGARKAERIHEMLVVANQLDFADVKAISIMSASRWLVKKGELQRLMWRDVDTRLTFGRKIHKQTVYVFLFTDLFVITKKKGDESFSVLDYCPRNMIQVEEHVRTEKYLGKPGSELGKNLILLTMLQNHENKTVEMILSCSSESDRTRWLEAVTPRTSDNPEEKIYEEWDCPQVQAIHPYVATQPDELSLEVTDVVNVLRKMADGWYQGERMRDGERGWFPGNYTVEIASSHVRARNLRQRYRLLALSGSFIEEQARKDREENGGSNGNKRKSSKKLSLTDS